MLKLRKQKFKPLHKTKEAIAASLIRKITKKNLMAKICIKKFDTLVKCLSMIIELLMIVVIGIIIGVLMVALYMLIFSMDQRLNNNKIF